MHCWHNDLVQTCNFFESVKRFYYERVFRQKVNIYSSIDRVNNPERFHYITSNSAFQRLPFCSFAFLCRYFNVTLLGMISFVVPFLLFVSIYWHALTLPFAVYIGTELIMHPVRQESHLVVILWRFYHFL